MSATPSRRITVLRVYWDDTQRPDGVDAEEWAYALRLGGVDAEAVYVVEDLPADWGPNVEGLHRRYLSELQATDNKTRMEYLTGAIDALDELMGRPHGS